VAPINNVQGERFRDGAKPKYNTFQKELKGTWTKSVRTAIVDEMTLTAAERDTYYSDANELFLGLESRNLVSESNVQLFIDKYKDLDILQASVKVALAFQKRIGQY